ncbi:copper resistance protein NlpE N-terminal domain-containing protein [uncultured Algibacter sp.]|uniref:copper resistance protein NlpE N-terminal domain-containing protein n=1 Tax=uncultured Algibacter sp. TaxID=298659 RepID=UPI00262E82B8|nr:copper resistance protein NlpE N-terminal domain-containing protein [uncultured Algibacter sp.]
MKKVKFLEYCSIVFVFALFSCDDTTKKTNDTINISPEANESVAVSQKIDGHSSQNTLDWEGVYKGTIPCADCEGIKTSITLLEGNKYVRIMEYLEKPDSSFKDNGAFVWDEGGAVIIIDEGNAKQSYKVGENVLIYLDKAGNQIEGDLAVKYRLMKNLSDSNLENKKWVLTELMGKEVKSSKDGKPAFVMFESKETRMSGNNSCNLFSGGYSLKSGGRIEVGQMMNTLMACDNMDVATQFMEVIQKADNYTVVNGVLHLNKARMAPLAKFTIGK